MTGGRRSGYGGRLKVSKKGFTLDNIELMDFLGEMGADYAGKPCTWSISTTSSPETEQPPTI